jgi:HSP20 family protein
VEVKEGHLHISGERKMEKEEKDAKFTRREFQFASFKRTFMLPDNVDAEKIAASYDNGMLKLMLPKLTVEEPKDVKKIAVN